MISQLRLSNIRLFEGPKIWQIDIAPVGVVCGANSSGKSTILKSLLFLRKNLLANQDILGEPTVVSFQASKEVDLGSFSSLVSHRDDKRDILVGASFIWPLNMEAFRTVIRGVIPDSEMPSIVPTLTISLDFTIGLQPSKSAAHTKNLSDLIFQDRDRPILKRTRCAIELDGKEVLSWSAVRRGDDYDLIFPKTSALALMPQMRVDEKTALRLAAPKSRSPLKLKGVLTGWLPGYYTGPPPEGAGDGNRQPAFYTVPFVVNQTNRFIRQEFSLIEYLGPLRAPAQRYYSMQEEAGVSDLDAAGERLPLLLQNMRTIPVRNVAPGSKAVKKETLELALNEWLHYLRAGSYDEKSSAGELQIRDIRGILLEAELASNTGLEKHALADSGFGYSQVLPIIAKTLMAQPGATILIEQPELHLNPALQVRIAEFFVAMARTNKQLIIETHSEHIVNALRLISAEDASGAISGLIAIYYIRSHGPKPSILRLGLKEDGTVDDWPPEFFGEALSLSSRLLKAQATHAIRKRSR